jgi:cyclic pyranopterin phosphate synthase
MRNGADDAELASILSGIWLRRQDRYSELRGPEKPLTRMTNKVEMYRVGG